MALRTPVLMLMLFSAAVFLLPLTVLIGEGPPPLGVLPTSQPTQSLSSAEPWPYPSSSAPPAAPSQKPAGVPDPPVTSLTLPADTHFRYYDLTDQRVKSISVRDYVRGALAAEMPASFHMEALKAQAVSAHTYALYCAEAAHHNPDAQIGGADFSADPKNRRGFITESEAKNLFGTRYDYYWGRICEAADTALDYVLLYEGQPILAAYHASSVGMTEAAENVWPNPLPYLVPVESVGDPLSPGYKTEVRMTEEAVRRALEQAFPGIRLDGPPEGWMVPTTFSSSGYILEAQVGDQLVSGSALRFALDLRSSAILIDFADGNFNFTTTGYGHGVGLSQYGADYLARQGESFEDILLHYYPGALLGRMEYAS